VLGSFSTKEGVGMRGWVGIISVFDKVEVILISFLEEMVKAVSNMFIAVIVLTASKLKIGLKLKGNGVSGFYEFNG